jgi:propionyl-CoA carboxylase beta chain
MKGTEELSRKNQLAEAGGGLDKLNAIRSQGRLTARERIDQLLDPGTFREQGKFVTHRCEHFGLSEKKFLGDGVITGTGEIHGRAVALFAQDFSVFGGSLAAAHASKIVKIMDLAEKIGCPVIGINDSGGARIQEGVESLGGYADIFLRNTLLSGVVPQISLIMGPCAGGAVYSPAITDFTLMVEGTSHMFITGPDVIKAVTKEEVSKEELGGAHTHHATSGVAHLHAPDEASLLTMCRTLFSFIPQNNRERAQRNATNDIPGRCSERLNTIIPDNPNVPYDMHEIIAEISDCGEFFEIQPLYAANIITGFIRLNGETIAVVANQPKHLAGCLDSSASTKAARFVRFCDAFNIPLLTLVDVPGFLPGVDQEHGGIIRHGAKLLYAFAEATVPKVTVITRKAYGGAYDVMSSKHIRADFNFAYPNSEIAVMGAEGAVNIIFKREIENTPPAEREALRARYLKEYKETYLNPWIASELGFIDKVFEPRETRPRVIEAFSLLKNKVQSVPRKKHGNIPL